MHNGKIAGIAKLDLREKTGKRHGTGEKLKSPFTSLYRNSFKLTCSAPEH
jgi:hypothetical protein